MYSTAMKDAVQRLVKIIAVEQNPHLLIAEVAADSDIVRVAQQLYREESEVPGFRNEVVHQLCLANHLPVDLFYDRLYLIARILNLADHTEDYYDILQVPPSASQTEIKHAFRRQSLAYHPDTNPDDPSTAEKFRSILRAYEIIGNEKLRAHYDRYHSSNNWEQQTVLASEPGREKRARKRSYLWMMGTVLVGLLMLVFLVDYQSLMTDKYYHKQYRKEASSKPQLAAQQKVGADPLHHPMPDALERSPNAGGAATLPGSESGDGGLLTVNKGKDGPSGRLYAQNAQIQTSGIPVRADRSKGASPQESPQMPPGSAADQAAAESDAAKKSSKSDGPTEKPAVAAKPVVSKLEQGSEKNNTALLSTDSKKDASTKSKEKSTESSPPADAGPSPSKSEPSKPQVKPSEPQKNASVPAESKSQSKVDKPKGDQVEQGTPAKVAEKAKIDAGKEVKTAATQRESPVLPVRKDNDKLPGSQVPNNAVSSPVESKDDSAKVVAQHPSHDPTSALTSRVEEFLRQYTQTYQQKNVARFLNLFVLDALENGQPVTQLASTYAKTFNYADSIQYRIKMQQCSPTADGVTVKGDFSLRLKPSEGDAIESRGSIQMRLIDMGSGFKVKQLNYAFTGKT